MVSKKNILMIAVVLFSICLSGCGRQDKIRQPGHFDNLKYGENENQTLDITFPPKEDANGGLILLIHGGAWVEGDKKNDYTDGFTKRFEDSGCVIASMNYRFTSSENSVTISEMLDDIRRVLNFIKDTSEDYGIHTKNAMLVGWSSGGHMAELYGYKMSQEADIPVTCVTAYSGIADLTDKELFVDNPLDEILNRPMTDVGSCLCGYDFDKSNMEAALPYLMEASPVSYTKTAVPTIICHSEIDTYVNYETAVHLKEELDKNNIDNYFIDFPKSGHDLLLDPDSLSLSYEKIEEYVKKYCINGD